MANDNELKVVIGSEIEKLKQGLNDAKESLGGAVQSMTGAMGGLSAKAESIATSIKGNFVAIGASIAAAISVEGIKKAVDAAQEYDGQIRSLSRTMGMTMEAASVLNVALRMIGSSSDEYRAAVLKLDMQLKKNEDSLNKIGMATRDSNGHLVSQKELFDNAVKTMLSYKEGVDRNEASLYLFGRSASEAQKFIKLNDETMREAERITKSYGLAVGEEAAAQSAKLSKEMRVLDMVGDAVKVQIGNQLIPEIRNLVGILSSGAPTAITVCVTAFKGLVSVMEAIGGVAIIMGSAIIGVLKAVYDGLYGLIDAALKTVMGDFKGAWQALSDGGSNMVKDLQVAGNTMVGTAADTYNAIKKLWSVNPMAGGESTSPKGTKSFENPEKDKKEKSRVGDWRMELEQMKEAENAFFGYSLDKEREFWTGKLALAKGHPEEYRAVMRQLFEIEKERHKQAADLGIEAQKTIIASEKSTAEQRIAAEERIVAIKKTLYGKDSVEYQRAIREREKLLEDESKKAIEAKTRTLETDERILSEELKAETAHYGTLRELGRINASEEVELLRQSEQDRYMSEVKTLGDIAALWREYPMKYKEMLDKIKEAVQKHNAEVKKLEDKEALEQKKTWDKFLSPVTSAMNTAVQGIIQGTTTLKDAMANIAQSILTSMVNMFTQMAMSAIQNQIMASMGIKTTKQAEAQTVVGSNAAEAASGAASAEASIPYVGPILAAAAAAAMMAMCMGFLSASAAGGYDIPAGVNPVVQAHAEEMILPSDLANKVRGMTDGGKGGGATYHTHNYTIQAWDRRDVGRFLKDNSKALAKAGEHAARRFQVRTR